MRVVYYAEPTDPTQKPKTVPDAESEEARWVTLAELIGLAKQEPGLRGDELLAWGEYIEEGGIVSPLSIFVPEEQDVALPAKQKPSEKQSEPKDEREQAVLAAVTSGDEAKVKQMLEAGYNPSTPITDKMLTPLHLAIGYQDQRIVSLLMQAGADMSACTSKGRNCLHFAAQSTVGILATAISELKRLDSGRQKKLLNAVDDKGNTPLHLAAKVCSYLQTRFRRFPTLRSDITCWQRRGPTRL